MNKNTLISTIDNNYKRQLEGLYLVLNVIDESGNERLDRLIELLAIVGQHELKKKYVDLQQKKNIQSIQKIKDISRKYSLRISSECDETITQIRYYVVNEINTIGERRKELKDSQQKTYFEIKYRNKNSFSFYGYYKVPINSLIIIILLVGWITIGLPTVKRLSMLDCYNNGDYENAIKWAKQLDDKQTLLYSYYCNGQYQEAIGIAKQLDDKEFLSRASYHAAIDAEKHSIKQAVDLYEQAGTDVALARADELRQYAELEGNYTSTYWTQKYSGHDGDRRERKDTEYLSIFIKDGKVWYRFDGATAELGHNAIKYESMYKAYIHFDTKNHVVTKSVDPEWDYYYREESIYYKD